MNVNEIFKYLLSIKLNRWKPLIIADVLRTSKALLWVDSSTLFVEDTLSLQVRQFPLFLMLFKERIIRLHCGCITNRIFLNR